MNLIACYLVDCEKRLPGGASYSAVPHVLPTAASLLITHSKIKAKLLFAKDSQLDWGK